MGNLFRKFFLRGTGLAVFLEILLRVLRRRQKRIHLDFENRHSFLIKVFQFSNTLPFFKPIKICADQLAAQTKLFALPALLQLGALLVNLVGETF